MGNGAALLVLAVLALELAAIVAAYFAIFKPEAPRPRRNIDDALVIGARDSLARKGARPGVFPGTLVTGAAERFRDAAARWPAVQRLRDAVIRAGFGSPEAKVFYQAVRAAGILAGFGIGMALAPMLSLSPILCGIAAGSLCYVVPNYVVQTRKRMRMLKISHELPPLLDLLVVILEAGIGLSEAIRLVGREGERQGRILGKELSAVSAEMGAGVSLADALEGLGLRTGVDDIKALSAVLIQSEQIGSRLAPALRAAADSLTAKRCLRAEEIAQKSSVKMLFPMILLILPSLLIMILGPAAIQIFQAFS
jgi:tight adherence protein C